MTFEQKFMKSIVGVNVCIFSYIFMFIISITIAFVSNTNLLKIEQQDLTNNPFNFVLIATLPMVCALVIFPLIFEITFGKISLKKIGLGFSLDKKFIKVVCHTISVTTIIYVFYNQKIDALPVFIHYGVSCLGEEILFRGILQRRMTEVTKPIIGILVASLLFAFGFHTQGAFIDNLSIRFPLGLILGSLYFKTKSIYPVFGLHLAYNFFVSF